MLVVPDGSGQREYSLEHAFVCGWLWGPVAWLWERMFGWQQDQMEAAKAELARLEGLLSLSDGALRLLAGRLTGRVPAGAWCSDPRARTGAATTRSGWTPGPSARTART